FSLAEYARSLSDVKNAVEVKVKFLMHIKNFIRNREFFGFVEEKIEGDVSTMTFLVDSLRWMAHWLLSYGGDAEVISPDSLKEMMIEEAQKILELYTPNTQ
ncbi:MAG: WYL domain-containing protein, partial [Deferribacteres bacterium]|nr:WYL domain-containing protein [Deferribacteres bacterium]